MTLQHRPLAVGLLALALGACDQAGDAPFAQRSGALIMDQLHNGGTEGFLFLPPMVPRPAHLGDVVPGVPVEVDVDEIDAAGATKRRVATFTVDAAKPSERVRFHEKDAPAAAEDDGDDDPVGYYVARWKTSQYALALEATYRVRVVVPGRGGKRRELGFADVDVVKNQKQFRAVNTNDYTPLVDGDVLRIKLRVDRPAVDGDGDGAFDWSDNCPSVANADQADALGNGIGDVCRCAELPADFGGVSCEAWYDGCGESGRAHVACAAAEPEQSLPTTLHMTAARVDCDGVSFVLDPAFGAGSFKAESKLGDKLYTLGWSQAITTKGKVASDIDVKLSDLKAQGLKGCTLSLAATATDGDGQLENGRLSDRGAEYPIVSFRRVPLTGADGAVMCGAHALDAAGSAVASQCGATSDLADGPRLPQFGHRIQDGTDKPQRHTFADLHGDFATARAATSGRFAELGRPVAGRLPNAGSITNDAEAFVLPLAKGQTSVTLSLRTTGNAEALAWLSKFSELRVSAAAGDGSGPQVERTVSFDAWPDGGLRFDIPPAAGTGPAPVLVLHGVVARNKNPPPPPPPPPPPSCCMEKLDLALEVEVK